MNIEAKGVASLNREQLQEAVKFLDQCFALKSPRTKASPEELLKQLPPISKPVARALQYELETTGKLDESEV